jgi:formate hydrogenlyase transcriptional activator
VARWQAGTFREDLFYRLNVFPIRLPSLRERPEDIPPLVLHFVRKHASRMKRAIAGVPTTTMSALTSWDWPGNIRELENVIERAVILATDGVLRVPMPAQAGGAAPSPAHVPPLNQLASVERDAILAALRAADGVVGGPAGAAARLGIRRTTLQSRMRKLGIVRQSY